MKTTSENTAVNGDLFVLERRDGRSYILYSPLNKKVGLINASGANTLHKYFRKEPLTPGETDYIDSLYENRFLNHVALSRPVFPANYDFMPHEVTLFATSRCNLRCRYCYAEAGKKSEDMSTEIAKAAIDLVANHAGRMGLPQFAVGFHGGGEPTVAWNFITGATEYAREMAERKGLEVEIFAASNGMFNDQQRDFILKHFTSLDISLDGPEDIQNHNRPCADSSGSFARVRENLTLSTPCLKCLKKKIPGKTKSGKCGKPTAPLPRKCCASYPKTAYSDDLNRTPLSCVKHCRREDAFLHPLPAKNIKQSIKTTVFMLRQRMNNNSRYFGSVHISLSTINSSLSMW
jgi:organic radical activating enzyme